MDNKQLQYWQEIGEIVANYTANQNDDGRYGRAFETMVNAIVSGYVSRSKPNGTTDTVVKSGVALESKTNRGELRADYATQQDAESALEAFYNGASVMKRATHVAYCFMPSGTPQDLNKARVFTRSAFENILRDNKLAIVSKGTNGNWRIVIQRYYPTGQPKILPNGEIKRYKDGTAYDRFPIKPEKSIKIIRALTEGGETIEDFGKRMVGKIGYALHAERA